jgi:kynurenine formamidase
MRTINIHQAKTHLSRLVDEAEKGDSIHYCQGWEAEGAGDPDRRQRGCSKAAAHWFHEGHVHAAGLKTTGKSTKRWMRKS